MMKSVIPGKYFRLSGLILALVCMGGLLRAEDKTKEVEAGDLKLTVPESWKFTQPSSNLRLAQAEVPAAEGDKDAAELVVFYFGSGGAGGTKANIDRWTSQFDAAGRKVKILEGTSSHGKYTLVDLQGTYNRPVGPPILRKTEKMPGARGLFIILSHEKQGDFFLRLTGPEKTVAANADPLRKAIGAKKDDEKEAK
ncbi:MAG: hypothetical protein U0903_03145 [Planctomycetales bacterium]